MLSSDVYICGSRHCGVCQDSNSIVLEVADDFCEVWLKDNYMSLLQDVLAVASGSNCRCDSK